MVEINLLDPRDHYRYNQQATIVCGHEPWLLLKVRRGEPGGLFLDVQKVKGCGFRVHEDGRRIE